MAEQTRERERDFERFLTFVDAVVAIAITLLVLPLVDIAGELREGESVIHLLGDHVSELVAFALSFVVISRLWLIQHRIMRHVVVQDGAVTRLTMVWLFLIVLLPFPTALVAEAGEDPTTKVFYVGTMGLSTLALAGICWAVARRRDIRDSDEAPRVATSLVTAVFLGGALLLMLLQPSWQYYPLLLLVLDDRLVALWDGWRQRRAG